MSWSTSIEYDTTLMWRKNKDMEWSIAIPSPAHNLGKTKKERYRMKKKKSDLSRNFYSLPWKWKFSFWYTRLTRVAFDIFICTKSFVNMVINWYLSNLLYNLWLLYILLSWCPSFTKKKKKEVGVSLCRHIYLWCVVNNLNFLPVRTMKLISFESCRR